MANKVATLLQRQGALLVTPYHTTAQRSSKHLLLCWNEAALRCKILTTSLI
jgi:hypothetical protein